MTDLLKLIPEGTSAIAVIVVVILFLQHLQKSNASLSATTQEFTKALTEQRADAIKYTQENFQSVSGLTSMIQSLDTTVRHTNTVVLELQRIVFERYNIKSERDSRSKHDPV